jgi:hypothetical protein
MTNLFLNAGTARCGFMIVLSSLFWFSPTLAQKTAEGIEENAFRELVSKFRDWKVDSAWGDVSKEDQKAYNYSALAAMSFSTNKFEAIDNKGIRVKGKWAKDTNMNSNGEGNNSSKTVSFTISKKRGPIWVISSSSTTGSKPYIVLKQNVCIECMAWYRLRPK